MTDNLDINTPRGRRTVADEMVARNILKRHHPDAIYAMTPRSGKATIDGVLVKEGSGNIFGVFETKCRYDLTWDHFMTAFKGEWLITKEKIDKGIAFAEDMGVPFYGFLFLVDERALLRERLWEPEKGWLVSHPYDTRETQKSCNGGTKTCEVYLIDMNNAKILK